jgi:hypothetical protein
MGWAQITKRTRNLTGASITVSDSSKNWRMMVYLRADVVAATGWQNGDYTEALIGDGEDRGKMLLRRVTGKRNGFVLRSVGNAKTTLEIRVPLAPDMKREHIPAKEVEWRMSGADELVLTLPPIVRVCPSAGTPGLKHYEPERKFNPYFGRRA